MDHIDEECINKSEGARSPSRSKSDDSIDGAESQDSVGVGMKEAAIMATEISPSQSFWSHSQQSNSIEHYLKEKFRQNSAAKRIFAAMSGEEPDSGGLESDDKKPRLVNRPWRTTLIRFGPLSGIFCMFLALACIIASLGVLAGSDGQAVVDWPVPPPTYLAIFTALANLSVRYAAISGVAIAWWYRAMKGSSLAKLHWDWKSGTTLRGAVTAGRDMGLLGIACIFSTIVVVDGPLLQRSTAVVSAPIHGSVPLDINMAPEIPRGYTGVWSSPAEMGVTVTQVAMFNSTIPGPHHNVSNYIYTNGNYSFAYTVVAPWQNAAPLDVISGCTGKCKAKIRAPALFASDCISHVQPGDYHGLMNITSLGTMGRAMPLDHCAWIAAVSLDVSGANEVLNMITGYANTDNCAGDFHLSICSLQAGIGEYDVSVDGNQTTLDKPVRPKFVAFANNTAVSHDYDAKHKGYPSTLAKVAEEGNFKWDAGVYYYIQGDVVVGASYSLGQYEPFQLPAPGACNSWSLNTLMVYVGAVAATEDPSYLATHMDPGLEAHTTTMGILDGEHNVFHTDYWFFLGAAVVEIACIALVIPTYWGWWKLGRPVSLSPLEMAKAFGSPMLLDCNSNSSGRDLAEAVGEAQVKYGVVQNENLDTTVEITFADPDRVEQPHDGMRFNV